MFYMALPRLQYLNGFSNQKLAGRGGSVLVKALAGGAWVLILSVNEVWNFLAVSVVRFSK